MKQGPLVLLTLLAFATTATPARGQNLRPSLLEIKGTYGLYATEHVQNHRVFGISMPYYVSPRFSVEPEVLYLRADKSDQEWVFAALGNFDFKTPPRRTGAYWGSGIGVTHSKQHGWNLGIAGPFRFGLKIFITDRLYISPTVDMTPDAGFFTVSGGYVLRQRPQVP